jgi:2EXR family
MSDLESFSIFPLLAIDIRLLIWEFTFTPRIISLEAEGYGQAEDPTAIPFYAIQGRKPPNPDRQIIRLMWSGRFIPSHIPSQAVFQVSRESRQFAFSLGYRIWTMQKRGGLIRNVIWNPAEDFILFPKRPFGRVDLGIAEAHPYHWLRMFAIQYPKEVSVAQNIAMHTSTWFQGKLEYNWVVGQLLKFTSMRKLVMVIDKDFEKDVVRGLITRNLAEESWGSWRIPPAIIGALENAKLRQPNLRLHIPDVLVVEDTSRILSTPGLETKLRCNPCEYLGIGQE